MKSFSFLLLAASILGLSNCGQHSTSTSGAFTAEGATKPSTNPPLSRQQVALCNAMSDFEHQQQAFYTKMQHAANGIAQKQIEATMPNFKTLWGDELRSAVGSGAFHDWTGVITTLGQGCTGVGCGIKLLSIQVTFICPQETDNPVIFGNRELRWGPDFDGRHLPEWAPLFSSPFAQSLADIPVNSSVLASGKLYCDKNGCGTLDGMPPEEEGTRHEFLAKIEAVRKF